MISDRKLLAWLRDPDFHLGPADRGLIAERLEAALEALFRCYVLAGADTDGAETLADMGQLTPGIDVLAVQAVAELWEDTVSRDSVEWW